MRRNLLLTGGLAALVGCAPPGGLPAVSRGAARPAALPATLPTVSGGPNVVATNAVDVQMTFVDLVRGRPPSGGMFFDVVLRNGRDEPRWFLFPTNLTPAPQAPPGGVSGVQVYEFGGRGRVVVGDFFGNGGFKALLAPPGAEIQLRRFGIRFSDHLPATALPLQVVVASQVTIGGEPASAWMGEAAMSDARAEVAADRGKMISARRVPGSREVPVTLVEDRLIELEVQLAGRR